MADPLIAEDLLLLLLDDESGKLDSNTMAGVDVAIGGALLVELSLRGAVEVTEKQAFRQPKVVPVTDASSLPPMLADSLVQVTEKERTAASLVPRLGKDRKQELLDRLVDKGMVRCERDKILGLFPRTRWPAEDSRRETDVRREIVRALRDERAADERTAALISLLSALDMASKAFSIDGLSGRDVRKRAQAISDGDWASGAVRDAVAAVHSAVTLAMIAATGAAST